MEPYVEMLINGGCWTFYEIHECDCAMIRDGLRWESESDQYLSEQYFDTSDQKLEKSDCCLQITELESGNALLSLSTNDEPISFCYLSHADESQDLLKQADTRIVEQLKERFGISIDDLHDRPATSFKPSIVRIGDAWLFLNAEIVYGSHQASLSCISADPKTGRELLDAVLEHFQIRKKSERSRALRFRSAKRSEMTEGTPEQNEVLYPCLLALGKGYETGCFDDFYPYLADECEKTSQWTYETVYGKENVIEYFREKVELSRKSGGRAQTRVVELVNHMNPVPMGDDHPGASLALFYSEGKLCLYLTQFIHDEIVRVIVDVDMDEDNKVQAICLCMPELFRFRTYRPERRTLQEENEKQ